MTEERKTFLSVQRAERARSSFSHPGLYTCCVIRVLCVWSLRRVGESGHEASRWGPPHVPFIWGMVKMVTGHGNELMRRLLDITLSEGQSRRETTDRKMDNGQTPFVTGESVRKDTVSSQQQEIK